MLENRPAITPAQIISALPIIAALLRAFGVYDLSPDQQDALGQATTWAIALLGADTLLRGFRNLGNRTGGATVPVDDAIPAGSIPAPADLDLSGVDLSGVDLSAIPPGVLAELPSDVLARLRGAAAGR